MESHAVLLASVLLMVLAAFLTFRKTARLRYRSVTVFFLALPMIAMGTAYLYSGFHSGQMYYMERYTGRHAWLSFEDDKKLFVGMGLLANFALVFGLSFAILYFLTPPNE